MQLHRHLVATQGHRVLLGAGLHLVLWAGGLHAEPMPLPYRSQAPFLPTIDLFGGPNKGLILGAEEVDRGRPAPVTIGNTTFFPQVRRAAELYGGFTRVNGDLEILHGDLYLGTQAVGATLQQNGSALTQQGSAIDQLQVDRATQQQTLQQHQGSLNSLAIGAAQAQQSIQQLNQSVTTLDQTTQQQSTLLQQHGSALTQQSATLLQQGAAITGLSSEMQEVKQSITVLDQNLNSLGNGVAGATALASALASLPVDSAQSPLSCGVGSGGYSDRYALAMGCAVNLASSLSLNAGGAYLFGGASSYGGGSLSDVAGRFGVSYRFGTRDGGPLGTARGQRRLENELRAIKEENRALQTVLVALQKRVDLLHASASQP